MSYLSKAGTLIKWTLSSVPLVSAFLEIQLYFFITLDHGGYSIWGAWSKCTKPCNHGNRIRTRSCTNPLPMNGGKTCKEQKIGDATQTDMCNTHKCPPRMYRVMWFGPYSQMKI